MRTFQVKFRHFLGFDLSNDARNAGHQSSKCFKTLFHVLSLDVVFTTNSIAQRCCNVNKFCKKRKKNGVFTVLSLNMQWLVCILPFGHSAPVDKTVQIVDQKYNEAGGDRKISNVGNGGKHP